jgi:hypothetical protein
VFRSVTSVIFLALLALSARAQERTPLTKTEAAPTGGQMCFSVTMQCFVARTTSAQPSSLDLRAPAIASVVPQSELQAVLPDPDEPKYDEPLVKVEGERGVPVNVPVGIMSLPWAVRHPTQLWRIFLPSPSRMTEEDED